MPAELDGKLRTLYAEGKTRKQAMEACGITNTNSMSSASSRLNLHWSWPLENRLGAEPPADKQQPKAPKATARRKEAIRNSGAPNAQLSKEKKENRAKATKEASSVERRRLVDSVHVPPIQLDLSPEALAPHLYKARPYQKGDELEESEKRM